MHCLSLLLVYRSPHFPYVYVNITFKRWNIAAEEYEFVN